MKLPFSIAGVVMVANTLLGASLPVITMQPQSQTVAQGANATLSVIATGAASYQWRYNGADVSGATNSTLQITNAQATNGYYMVVVKNDTGWVPSQLVYLSISFTKGGTVPFSTVGDNGAQAYYAPSAYCNLYNPTPITNGTAQVVAGPELDQMKTINDATELFDGYFVGDDEIVPTVGPGQPVYYRVDITYTNCTLLPYTQQSTVLKLTAGGGGFSTPSAYGLKFPTWPEWPEPWTEYIAPTDQVRVLDESFSITNWFGGYADFGIPTFQWRKDGVKIANPTSFVQGWDHYIYSGMGILSITNARAADAGIYDVVVLGNNWFIGPKTTVSIQLVNGEGIFESPRLSGSNFVCDLVGALSRNYAIEWSTNLYSWSNLLTLSNITGTITFSNSLDTASAKFFRTRLLQ